MAAAVIQRIFSAAVTVQAGIYDTMRSMEQSLAVWTAVKCLPNECTPHEECGNQ